MAHIPTMTWALDDSLSSMEIWKMKKYLLKSTLKLIWQKAMHVLELQSNFQVLI